MRNRPGVCLVIRRSKDQLHVIGPADVEVLADHFLEEDAAGGGTVEDLGQGELSLKDRNVVAIAGCSILGREGVRDARQPLPEQHVDLVGRESIAELLQSSGIGAAQNAIVQGLEGYPFLGQLSLDVLMAVDAQLGVVGEVGAELEKERAEVLVDAIEVVMIDYGRGPHDPGVRLTGLGVTALLGAEDGCLLLRLPTTTIPSVPLKRGFFRF